MQSEKSYRLQHAIISIVAFCIVAGSTACFLLERHWKKGAYAAKAVVVAENTTPGGASFVTLRFEHPEFGIVEFKGLKQGQFNLAIGQGLDILYNLDYPDLPYPYRLNNGYDPWILTIIMGSFCAFFFFAIGLIAGLPLILKAIVACGLVSEERLIAFAEEKESDDLEQQKGPKSLVKRAFDKFNSAYDFFYYNIYGLIISIIGCVILWSSIYSGFIARIPSYDDLEHVLIPASEAKVGEGDIDFRITYKGKRYLIEKHVALDEFQYTQIQHGAYPKLSIRYSNDFSPVKKTIQGLTNSTVFEVGDGNEVLGEYKDYVKHYKAKRNEDRFFVIMMWTVIVIFWFFVPRKKKKAKAG